MTAAEKLTQKSTEIFCLTIYRKMQPNWLGDPSSGSKIMTQNIDPSSGSKIMTQNIVPKQQRRSSGQEVEGLRLAKSISTLKPCRVCILPAKETEGSNPPKLKEAAVKAWKSITKEECKSLVMSMGHRLDAVIESKGFATKY